MSKTLNGGALISYGPTLPTSGSTPDGALFYKTDSSGGKTQGLYVFGFVKDVNPSTLGSQVAQDWILSVSPDLYVLKAGDTMLGGLSVPSLLKITQTSNAQRILIGNQDSLGANKPVIFEGANGVLTIGTGSNWSNGGTLTSGLTLNVSNAGTGITWLGNQVWHAGEMGAGSSLDADKLDGQEGAYYQDAGNMVSGVLPVARGGTGNGGAPNLGGVIYGNVSGMSSTPQGTAGQVLTSGGAGSPVWVNQSTLSVGNAVNANTANTANTATTAVTAGTAAAVPWTGITGLNAAPFAGSSALQTFTASPASGFTTHARPSYFYDMGNTGALSMTPPQFPIGSLTGFDAYNNSDMALLVGLTSMGTGGNGTRAMQIAAAWNYEESAPASLHFRVNDDSSNTSAWGAWATVWTMETLVNVSTLVNDANYVTASNVASIGGLYRGLKVSASGISAAVQVTVEELVVANSTDGSFKTLSSINLVGMAVGQYGANGLDTGVWASNTWYSVWVIWNGTTVSGLFSASQTAPTMPSGYTHKARVGWIRTDSTVNKYPLGFVQYGRDAAYIVGSGNLSVGHPQTTAGAISGSVSLVNFVPPTASGVRLLMNSHGSVDCYIFVGSTPVVANGAGVVAGIVDASPAGFPTTVQTYLTIFSTPRAFYIAAQASTSTYVYGWEDNL